MGKLTIEQARMLIEQDKLPWSLSEDLLPSIRSVPSYGTTLEKSELVKRVEQAVRDAFRGVPAKAE